MIQTLINKGETMPLSDMLREQVTVELKKFATELNLSDDQKQKLQTHLTDAYQKVQEYKQQNPNASREDLLKRVADNRATIRQRITSFLTPDQLTKWDAEVSKVKDFLGEKMAA
jgi:predicted HTH transcriptional regulator